METIAKILDALPANLTHYPQQFLMDVLKQGPIPKHVAFIMDGNRRYARKKGISTPTGHSLGFNSLEKILESCLNLGISAVTAYAFSIDNFKRSKEEVEALMLLAKEKLEYFCTQSELIKKHQVSIRVIGKLSLLPKDVQVVVNKAMRLTSSHKKATLTICFPYTSTDELANVIFEHIDNHKLDSSLPMLTEDTVESHLYTYGLPKLDLLVRTSGEIRLSDFLLWQTSTHNCQLHFVKVLWPEFSIWNLFPILLSYQVFYRNQLKLKEA